jgi:hypothetical protein
VEFQAAARAGEVRYHVPADTSTCTQGVRDERTSQRDGLPQAPERGARYTDVRTSFRVAAWLECEDDGAPAEAGNGAN